MNAANRDRCTFVKNREHAITITIASPSGIATIVIASVSAVRPPPRAS
jgi:hypothetical protein